MDISKILISCACLIGLSACVNTAAERPETQIKYFVVPAENWNGADRGMARTALSSGEVKLYVDQAGCLRARNEIDEELKKIHPEFKQDGEFVPVFFPDVIVGSDQDGFFIRDINAIEKYRNQPDIIGADPIRLGVTTGFGISNPPGIQGVNGADQNLCAGPYRGTYLNPPFKIETNEKGQKSYRPLFLEK